MKDTILSQRTRLAMAALRQWKTVAVVLLTLIAIGQFYRDELLKPEQADQYTARALLDRYLPDWPWGEWWVIGALTALLIIVVDGMTRIVLLKETDLEKLRDDLMPSLAWISTTLHLSMK